MKKIVGIGMLVLLLSGGVFLSNAMSISDFFKGLIGWSYQRVLKSCIAKAIDPDGNVIEVQGARVVCYSGDASCEPSARCEPLQP